MSHCDRIEVGRLVFDVLCNFERIQYTTKHRSFESSDIIYFLYSSVLKLIKKAIDPEKRNNRIFRLKYHHILADESVDEYLFHCLSKILMDVMEEENNYHKYIAPVVELHMKLISILSAILERHNKFVMENSRVMSAIERYNESGKKWKSIDDSMSTEPASGNFQPLYYVPPLAPAASGSTASSSSKVRKANNLTQQAISAHYAVVHHLSDDVQELLLDFDCAFAEFELDFVCQVNKASILTPRAAELTMEVVVLFSDTIRWGHSRCLLRYEEIAECDIEMMVAIPRLVVLYGCAIADHGPLSESSLNMAACHSSSSSSSDPANLLSDHLAPVFCQHLASLGRLRRQLGVLTDRELGWLVQLLLQHSNTAADTTPSKMSPAASLALDCAPSGDLHSLYKLIAVVADQMQSSHASDYRFFMQLVYLLFKDEPDPADQVPDPGMRLPSQSVTGKKPNIKQKQLHKSEPNLQHLFTTLSAAAAASSTSTSSSSSVESAIDALIYPDPANQQQTLQKEPGNDHSNSISSLDLHIPSTSAAAATTSSINSQPHTQLLKPPHLTPTGPSTTINKECCTGDSSNNDNRQQTRPVWRSDSQYPNCCHCQLSFTVFRRRHHCRRCGYLFCSKCWGHKLSLPSLGVHASVPVCVECEQFVTATRAPQPPAQPGLVAVASTN